MSDIVAELRRLQAIEAAAQRWQEFLHLPGDLPRSGPVSSILAGRGPPFFPPLDGHPVLEELAREALAMPQDNVAADALLDRYRTLVPALAHAATERLADVTAECDRLREWATALRRNRGIDLGADAPDEDAKP